MGCDIQWDAMVDQEGRQCYCNGDCPHVQCIIRTRHPTGQTGESSYASHPQEIVTRSAWPQLVSARFQILVSCRRWWNELSIVGFLPTRIRAIWHRTSSQRTVATIPRKRHLCGSTTIWSELSTWPGWRASSSRHVGCFRYSGPSNHVRCSEPSLRYSRCCADLVSFVFRWKIPGGQGWFWWVEDDEVVNWFSSRISSRPKIFRLLSRGCARNLQTWGTFVPSIRRRHAGTSKFAATGCSQNSRESTGLYHCGF